MHSSSGGGGATADKRLHWTQRIALVRHNLHGASSTGDFSFFKTLQAHAFLDGADHVANLSALLEGRADELLQVLDNLNTGIAYVHEDAFRHVYEELRRSIEDRQAPQPDAPRARTGVGSRASSSGGGNDAIDAHQHQQQHHHHHHHPFDGLKQPSIRSTGSLSSLPDAKFAATYHSLATQQRQLADSAIDKMMSSAMMLIRQQPSAAQDTCASILVLGTTFIADAMEAALAQLARLEGCADDLPRAEACWARVQNAVAGAVSALKGILNMLDANEDPVEELVRQNSRAARGRAKSTSNESSGAWSAIRRMSSVFTGSTTESPTHSRKASVASIGPFDLAGPPPQHVSVLPTLDGKSPAPSAAASTDATPKSPIISKFSWKAASDGAAPKKATALHSHAAKRPLSGGGGMGTVLEPIPPTPTQQLGSYEFFGQGGAEKDGGIGGDADGVQVDHVSPGVEKAGGNASAFGANAGVPPEAIPPVPENTPYNSRDRVPQRQHADGPVGRSLKALAENEPEVIIPPKVVQRQPDEVGGEDWPLHARRWSETVVGGLPAGTFESLLLAQ